MRRGQKFKAASLLVVILASLSACSMFSAAPERVIRDYGNSVQSMVNQSIYNKEKAAHPALNAPDGIEGQKAAVVYQRAYQSDIGAPNKVRAPAQLGIANSGGGGSGN